MNVPDQDNFIFLNGINGAGAGYLVQPFTTDELRDRARKLGKGDRFSSEDHLLDLKLKGDPAGAAMAIPADSDPEKLQTTGWGMIFPADAAPKQVEAILEALSELLKLRKGQAGQRFRLFKGGDGYRPGESADAFIARHGGQPGTPDVDKVPYYLLIIADPQSIPFQFQYELDVQYGVGRIYFESLDEYARYARSVLWSETPGKVKLAPRAAFFGVANGIQQLQDLDADTSDLKFDRATFLSARSLVPPLYNYTNKKHAELGWAAPRLVSPLEATKATLANLLGGAQTPALLFTASHGLGWPYGHAYQYPFQGALVTQDWPGPSYKNAPTRDMYFGAEDLDAPSGLLGMVAIFFACFSGGTPYWDDYAVAQDRRREALAHRAFLAALPRKMLSNPRGGALAVIAHVERAWGYSFKWQGGAAEPTSFQNMLYQVMKGIPVGYATEHLNLRYAQFATMLESNFETAKYNKNFDPRTLSTNWLAANDSRAYALIGDPAVRLSVAAVDAPAGHPAFKPPRHRSGSLPVVLVLDSISPEELPNVKKEIPDQSEVPDYTEDTSRSGKRHASVGGDAPVPGSKMASGGKKPPSEEPVRPPTAPSVTSAAPYASPMDGLAFALQAYTGEGKVSYSLGGEEGVSFDILEDAKKMVGEVVANLNTALRQLSRRMLETTDQALTLEVTTSLVEDLDAFDPLKPGEQKAAARFKTMISATGDIEAYLPSLADSSDEVLLKVHMDMVRQAMLNRTELAKTLGELVANLFSPSK